MDTYELHDPSLYRHVVVVRGGEFYQFDFVDEDHNPLPQAVIESRLNQVIAVGCNREELPGGIGVLTAGNRDTWANDREELIKLNPNVIQGLRVIQSAAVVVCLDDKDPVSVGCASEGVWNGRENGGGNRWFDKPVQIVVYENGKAGLLGEHSMMDGMPMVRYADYLVKNNYGDTAVIAPMGKGEYFEGGVKDVFENVPTDVLRMNPSVTKMVGRGMEEFNKLVGDQELTATTFRGFGAKDIKKFKMSPDAFVQCVIQVATTRLFGKSVGTYEASQVRVFRHGRTETTRSCSLETVELCKAMGMRNDGEWRSKEEAERRVGLLRKAANSHVGYLKKAAKGEGVDRHMFGLKMLLKPREKVPELFNNPIFNAAKTWRVSTSHLTHPSFDNWGWGEVVPNGVGIAYSIHGDRCVFNVTARKDTGYSRRLAQLLEDGMVETWGTIMTVMQGGSKL
jgi:carnitine O-acetyltransferase